MPTFKVQGQIYHRIGSLLPALGQAPSFLQIYFMGNENEEVNRRHQLIPGANREIVTSLQRILHQYNALVEIFRYALDQMPNDGEQYEVRIRADMVPAGQHARRYNAPTTNEVAIVMVGDQAAGRDIVIQQRDTQLRRIAETHRSYDALQYPLLFCRGEDGYNFTVKQINPNNDRPTSKKACIYRIRR